MVGLAQREVCSIDELNSVDCCVGFAIFFILLNLLTVSEFGVVATHLESINIAMVRICAIMCSSF